MNKLSKLILCGLIATATQAFAQQPPIYQYTIHRDIEAPLPYRGGGGGGLHELDCDYGSAVVGFTGRAGDYLDRLGIICSPLNIDNGYTGPSYEIHDQFGHPIEYGGNGGGAFDAIMCPDGAAVVEVDTASGNYIDSLQFACAYPPFISLQFTTIWTGWSHSSGGGGYNFDVCPNNNGQGYNGTGYVVDRISVRAGGYIDGIQPICSYVSR